MVKSKIKTVQRFQGCKKKETVIKNDNERYNEIQHQEEKSEDLTGPIIHSISSSLYDYRSLDWLTRHS